MDDWYRVTAKDIKEFGGSSLLAKFGGSPSKLLQYVYPNHDWALWKFQTTPQGFWQLQENIKNFAHRMEDQLQLKQMSWYAVTTKLLQYKGGSQLLQNLGIHLPSSWNMFTLTVNGWVGNLILCLTDIGNQNKMSKNLWMEWDSNLESSKWKIGTDSQQKIFKIAEEANLWPNLVAPLSNSCIIFTQIITGNLGPSRLHLKGTGNCKKIFKTSQIDWELNLESNKWRIGTELPHKIFNNIP